MKLPPLSPDERYVLGVIREYGGGTDFGGRHANRKHMVAARSLVEKGLLRGSYRCAWLADKGSDRAPRPKMAR